jgi:hypothetical protein
MAKATIWLTPRIWFGEGERIGMQRCTPIGYVINGIGGLFWVIAVLEVPALPVYLIYLGFAGAFHASLLWLLIAPLPTLLAGSFLIGISWVMAIRRDFDYHYERDESTWIRNGVKISYSPRARQAVDRTGAGE